MSTSYKTIHFNGTKCIGCDRSLHKKHRKRRTVQVNCKNINSVQAMYIPKLKVDEIRQQFKIILNDKHKICKECKNIPVIDWVHFKQLNQPISESINEHVTILSPLHSTTTTQIKNKLDLRENEQNKRSLLFDPLSNSRVKALTSLSKEEITVLASESNCNIQQLFIILTMFRSGISMDVTSLKTDQN